MPSTFSPLNKVQIFAVFLQTQRPRLKKMIGIIHRFTFQFSNQKLVCKNNIFYPEIPEKNKFGFEFLFM